MLPVLLVLTSTFSLEIAQSLGKKLAKQRRENVYQLGFLALFWGLVFMVVSLAFGAPFHLSAASLPTLSLRVILEVALAVVNAEAIIKADRSTVGFLRLITIPLLLVIDISLGYHITQWQLVGVGVMFAALVLAFRHNPLGRKGAGLAALSGFLAVGTVSLYKYDISHFNSVAAEQIVVLAILVSFFYIQSARSSRRSPLKMLFHPNTGTQALASGIVIPLESFAMSLAPASVIIAYKRSFALIWSIIFGGAGFHEHSLARKMSSAALMVVSLVLITGLYH